MERASNSVAQEDDTSSESSHWSLLPEDILALIAGRLSPTSDFLGFGSVCTSWRSVSGKDNYPPFHQMPWLMLAEDNPKSMSRRFFSPSEDAIYELELPEARCIRFVGSTDGWLVTIAQNLQVRMLNPMSRIQVSLPPLAGLSVYHSNEGRAWPSSQQKRDWLISKVCLSPGAPKNCTAMAIYGHLKLAFARPGDSLWTDINSRFWPFCGVIYFKGAFHAVSHRGYVVTVDVTHRRVKVRNVAHPVSERLDGWTKYLVEFLRDLLQVARITETTKTTYKTVKFEVYKWEPSRGEWEEMRSLGDQALFLGINTSLSVSALDASGCRPNSIYFTDDNAEMYDAFDVNGGGGDMGVYSLEDGTIEPHYTGYSRSLTSPPLWVQPTLWRKNAR